MGDARHYDCLVTKPAKESRYAFVATSFAISDAEPSAPLWLGPIETTLDMSPIVKAFWERHNYWISLIENDFRRSAIERLRRAGFPETNLVAPLNSEVESLVMELVKGDRLSKCSRYQTELENTSRQSKSFDGQKVDRDLCTRVIGAALISRPGGHEATARYLNQGLPSGAQGLTRHHVLRAFETLRRKWRRSSRNDGLVDLALDCDLLAALDIVYAQARQHRKFRRYRGNELAWAIHEAVDLNEPIHRALKFVQARHLAAV
jgi:hypothetical protein